ncbi:unnamed protein product [Rhizophagus irregularis]|nr:unnamed protein product [Rhizophagus irregularis]
MEDSSEEEKEERDEADTSTFRGNTFLEMPPVRRTKKTLTSSQSSTEDNAFQTFQTQTLASSVLLRNPNIDIVQSSQNNNNVISFVQVMDSQTTDYKADGVAEFFRTSKTNSIVAA